MGIKSALLPVCLTLLAACAAPTLPEPVASPAVERVPCDCAWYAYEALKRINARLRTVPAVIQTDAHGGHGYYQRGVVGMPDVTDCKVMVHEFVHHYQLEHYGEIAVNQPETKINWDLNELEAETKTARARNMMGDCQ